MFLWAALQIQSLCTMKTDHAIRKALKDLPKDLAQTFARILHKSGVSDPSLQAKTLEVVLAAHRPLTTEELREALSVDPGHAIWDPSKMLNNIQSALSCCGCLLTVDEEESTVRVTHHSVKQYLLHCPDNMKLTSFSVERAHGTLADIIVTYLGYGVFETQLTKANIRPILVQSVPSTVMRNVMGSSSTVRQYALKLLKSNKQSKFDLSKTVAEARGQSCSEPQDGFKFFGYANTNWQNHIPYVSSQIDDIYELAAKLIRTRSSDLEMTDADSDLYWSFAAAAHRDTRILELLLRSQKIMQHARNVLEIAVKIGDMKMIDLLLNAGVDANGNLIGTPIIILAVSHGNSQMIKMLLNSSTVDVNAREVIGDTAIKMALDRGNKHIFKLLLSSDKIDVNVKDIYGSTLLLWAIDNASMDIVKLLLNKDKIDVNVEDRPGSTALLKAVKLGAKDIVQQLLRFDNLEVEATDTTGKTALLSVVCSRNDAILKLLLDRKDVNVNAKDKDGNTALLEAVRRGYSDMVKLILASEKIDVNTKDASGWTPLMCAAFHGETPVVKLLLANGKVDCGVKGPSKDTALTLATQKDHQDVVELLLMHTTKSGSNRRHILGN